jgi:hypothetical protein
VLAFIPRMASALEQLKWSLQALALPPATQHRLFPTFVCVADELALDFDDSLKAATPQASFTPAQRAALAALDDLLAQMSGQQHAEFWTDSALENHSTWQQIRDLARRALDVFGWDLQSPPMGRAMYVGGPDG